MSIRLTFTELPAPPAEIRAGFQNHSELSVKLVLRRVDKITRPIAIALKLKSFGLRLREAHEVLDSIVVGKPVQVRLVGASRAIIVADFAHLGVSAE